MFPPLLTAPTEERRSQPSPCLSLGNHCTFRGQKRHLSIYFSRQNRYTKVSTPKSTQPPSAQLLAILGHGKTPDSGVHVYKVFYVEHFVKMRTEARKPEPHS